MIRRLTLSILLIMLPLGFIWAQESGMKIYRLYTENHGNYKQIEREGVLVVNIQPGKWIDLMATEEQVKRLKGEGEKVELLAADFQELAEESRFKEGVTVYHDYQSMRDELFALAAAHPDILKLDTIGLSVLGKAIYCMKVSDNPGEDEDEIPVLIVGNHHGNEILSVEATMFNLNYLINNYQTNPEVAQWVSELEIWFVPMMNPDGHAALRRTNENGVDLNRNYSFGFTAGGNHGPEAFSEPETRAIRDLVSAYPPAISLSYHTSGQLVLYAWTHTDEAAPDSTSLIYLGDIIARSIVIEGESKPYYELRQGGDWYFTAGEYCDYLYRNYDTRAYTIEMWTRQAPESGVIPTVVNRNLGGFIATLQQAFKAGVTGLITDARTGQPLRAEITLTDVDNQGKLLPRLSDSLFGRYYRYLAPGTYRFKFAAPGYRPVQTDLSISADSLIHYNVALQTAPMLEITNIELNDAAGPGTGGNNDGLVNISETIALKAVVDNYDQSLICGCYALISTHDQELRILNDSLFFGDVAPETRLISQNQGLIRVDPGRLDGDSVTFTLSLYDSEGWVSDQVFSREVYAPQLEFVGQSFDDSEGNGNGVIDRGESGTLLIRVANTGRQHLTRLKATLAIRDNFFVATTSVDESHWTLEHGDIAEFSFRIALQNEAPEIAISEWNLEVETFEHFDRAFTNSLTNVDGYFFDFEAGTSGWVHDSYRSTQNDHDDWQLGTPSGAGLGDPDRAWSGINCWATDLGLDEYNSQSWDGNYQDRVYNYLKSPSLDCSQITGTGLRFMRELNVRINDYARIKVNDVVVWESIQTGHSDAGWTEVIIDISAIADRNTSVEIVFELESNSVSNMGGWNIDDVVVGGGLASISSSAPMPMEAAALHCWPNPFSDHLYILSPHSSENESVIQVMDLRGSIIHQHKWLRTSGEDVYRWDGRHEDGHPVRPGVYLIVVDTGGERRSAAVTRIK